MTLPHSHVIADQRAFFTLLEEFFTRATGYSVKEFEKLGRFDEVIRANAERIAKRGEAFPWFEPKVRSYYAKQANASYDLGKSLGGMKLVLGGGSQFTQTHVKAVQKMTLYSDTILLPDPVLPWFEDERLEERFRHVRLLENSFFLLHLKPLVDADLPYPAVIVFPSWERSLERFDAVTVQGQVGLYAAFMSHYLRRKFENPSDVLAYASANQEAFFRKVDELHLFVPPGGSNTDAITEAVARYRQHLSTWRTTVYGKSLEDVSDAELVALGIAERVGPQYHLLENAEEFASQPMLCLEAQWAYHTMIARMQEKRLEQAGALRPQTVATLRAMNQPSLAWLGNVPVDSLVELRRNNENESFRKKLADYTASLNQSQLGDLDRVAAEMGRGLASLIADHEKEVRRIENKYKSLHVTTLIGAWATLGAVFMPALAPFVGGPVAPMAIAAKYIRDKVEEQKEKREAALSLTGVLASAQK